MLVVQGCGLGGGLLVRYEGGGLGCAEYLEGQAEGLELEEVRAIVDCWVSCVEEC